MGVFSTFTKIKFLGKEEFYNYSLEMDKFSFLKYAFSTASGIVSLCMANGVVSARFLKETDTSESKQMAEQLG